MGDRFDEMVDVIDKILKTRNLTPSQYGLMMSYKKSLEGLQQEEGLKGLVNELFRSDLEHQPDFYGERLRSEPVTGPAKPTDNESTVPQATIKEFLPNPKNSDQILIEPYSYLRQPNRPVEL